MNMFEKFSLSREISMKDGEIILDQQRLTLLPVNFVGNYLIQVKDNQKQQRILYEVMKKGFIEYAMKLGKEYFLSYRDFLDRWVKYCDFGGWGIVKYQLVEKEENCGFLHIKDLPLHLYLKSKGVKEPSDPIWEGLVAGSLMTTFKGEIEVVEVKCICSGNDVCVFYWGPRKYLKNKFPEIVSKRFGGDKE
jgi:predicted hydrocarbon binding protein